MFFTRLKTKKKIKPCNFLKKTLSLVSALVIAGISLSSDYLSVTQTSVSAALSSSEMASSMIDYYRQKNSVLSDLTEEDVKSFGVFISNFYVPFVTNVLELDNNGVPTINESIYNTMSFLKGDNITEDDPIGSMICGELQAQFMNNSAPLVFKDGTVATVELLFTNDKKEDKALYMLDDTDRTYPVFRSDFSGLESAAEFKDEIFSLILMTCLQVGFTDDLNKTSAAYLNELFDKSLYVSSYGDILTEDGVIIVPSCLNPYVFSKEGDKLPVNNTFFMGNLALTNGLKNSTSVFLWDGSTNSRIPSILVEANISDNSSSSLFAYGMQEFSPSKENSTFSLTSTASYNFFIHSCDNLKKGSLSKFFNSDYAKVNEVLNKWISKSLQVSLLLDNVYSDFAAFTTTGTYAWSSDGTSTTADEAVKIGSLLDSDSSANTCMNSPSANLFLPIYKYYCSLPSAALPSLTFSAFYKGFSNDADNNYSAFCTLFKAASSSDYFLKECANNASLDMLELLYISLAYDFFSNPSYYIDGATDTKATDVLNNCSKYLSTLQLPSLSFFVNSILGSEYTTVLSLNDLEKISEEDVQTALYLYILSVANLPLPKDKSTIEIAETNLKNPDFDFFFFYLWGDYKGTSDTATEILANRGESFISSTFENYFYQIFAFNQEIARLFASHKPTKNIQGTNLCYFANFYYAYINTLASYEDWYFPPITLNSTTANILAAIEEEAQSKLDTDKLLKAQWDALNTYKKITSTGGSTNADNFQKSWFNNTFSNLILSWHEGIVGTSSVGTEIANTGNTNNVGVITYGTVPRLQEMFLFKQLVDNYKYLYCALMIVVLVSIFFMFMLQIKSFARAISLFLVMGVLFTFPLSLIDSSIVLTNKMSSVAYTNKFKFWAIMQHQLDVQMLTGAVEADESAGVTETTSLTTTDLTVAALQNKNYYSTTSVRLKWMSPKKLNVLDNLLGNSEEGSLQLSTNIFKWLFSGYFQQESYSADRLATYVYRPYSDLCSAALSMWTDGIQGDSSDSWRLLADMVGTNNSVLHEINKEGVTDTTLYTLKDKNYSAFNLQPINADTTYNIDYYRYYINENNLKSIAYYSSALSVYSALSNTTSTADTSSASAEYLDYYNLWSKYAYRQNIVDDSAVSKLFTSSDIYNSIYFSELSDGFDNSKIGYNQLSDGDGWTGDSLAFMLYSESPFYYFYNVFKNSYTDDFKSDDTSATSNRVYGYEPSQSVGLTGFSKLLISDDFFFADDNSKYAGMLKDFMGLEQLFALIIPYLRNGNDYVKEWIQINGNSFDFYAEENSYSQYHTKNLEQVWALYSPWVDALEESWSGSTTVKMGSEVYTIDDMLNPFTYLYSKNEAIYRYMAFGEADVSAKGYGTDLTSVEKHISNVLDKTYTDLRYLVNYSGFDNEVLISMAAMLATFNFNSEFTKAGLNTAEMYPTGFELQNFSYDSYLRLILLNATGYSFLTNSGTVSIYKTVMQESGVAVGFFIVVLDVFCVWILPALKFVFVMGLTIFVLIMTLIVFFQHEEGIFSLIKVMLMPILQFIGICMLHTYGTSIFMGDGLTDYVGSQEAVMTTNSAGVTLIIILALNVIVTILYVKAFISLVKKIGKWGVTAVQAFTSLPNELGARLSSRGSFYGTHTGVHGYTHTSNHAPTFTTETYTTNNMSSPPTTIIVPSDAPLVIYPENSLNARYTTYYNSEYYTSESKSLSITPTRDKSQIDFDKPLILPDGSIDDLCRHNADEKKN